MEIYKKIKKDFILAEPAEIKIGDIIKIYSTKTNHFVTKACFVENIIGGDIYLQEHNSTLKFELASKSLVK